MLNHNILFSPARSIPAIVEMREKLPSQIPLVMHLHWTTPVLHNIHDRDKAQAAADAYIKQLKSAKAKGISIVWTIHNELPHDSVFEDMDMDLQQRVLELCDAVHIMSERTEELCAAWFAGAPTEKICVPHPSYHGAYPDYIGRADARMQLGISPGETVFLLFGAIKPYKGLIECAEAIDVLAQERPVRLIVAGQPDKAAETARFLESASTNPAIITHADFIGEQDVQVFFRAADISVLPYRRTLNSGSLALALSFGLPVVMPQDSGSLPLLDPSFSVIFDGANPAGLQAGLREAMDRLCTPQARSAAEQAGLRVRSDLVAEDFARECQLWIARHQSHSGATA
jgi:glycosyltransferase involved in cell wall biosynthesis